MPPFPERESSILAILKKKKPGRVAEPGAAGTGAGPEGSTPPTSKERKSSPAAIINNGNSSSNSNQNADLLGLTSPPATSATGSAPLVDVLADVFNAAAPVNNGFGASFQPVDNIKKYS